MKTPANFAPWSETENTTAAASDSGSTEALQQAAEELSQAISQLSELIQQFPTPGASAATPSTPLSIQITVTDAGGNSLPFTTPDGPDLSLFS